VVAVCQHDEQQQHLVANHLSDSNHTAVANHN
jgi:hypothetical protein